MISLFKKKKSKKENINHLQIEILIKNNEQAKASETSYQQSNI